MPVLLAKYFEDFDNSGDAHQAYLEDLKRLAEMGPVSINLAWQVAIALQDHADRLNAAFESGMPDPRFAADWQCRAKIFVGDAKGRHYTRFVGDGRVVALDWTSFIKLALMVRWIGWDGEDGMAHGLATFLLIGYVVDQGDEFPNVDELLSILYGQNPRIMDDLLSLVGDFLLFHEIGHVYCDDETPDHLSIKFITPDAYDAGDWQISETPLYDGCTLFHYEVNADGSQLGSILMPADQASWREEFACDVFALHGLLYASAGKKVKARDIGYVCDAMSIWQIVLWIVGWKQMLALGQESNEQGAALSHPPSKLRFDFLIYHTFKLALDHLPRDADIPLGSVLERASRIWDEETFERMRVAIEYSHYGFDEDSDRVNVGQLHSFTADGHIPYHPSAFAQIRRIIMTDFIPHALTDGWEAASGAMQPEFRRFIDTYQSNERPVIRELGEHLHAAGLRLVSEDRP